MRTFITVTFRIGLNEAGEVEVSRPTVQASEAEGGMTNAFNALLHKAQAAAVNATPAPPVDAVNATPAVRAKTKSALPRAQWLADQLKIPPGDLEAALATHTAERVCDVLEWVRGKASREPVRSPQGLMWSVLARG